MRFLHTQQFVQVTVILDDFRKEMSRKRKFIRHNLFNEINVRNFVDLNLLLSRDKIWPSSFVGDITVPIFSLTRGKKFSDNYDLVVLIDIREKTNRLSELSSFEFVQMLSFLRNQITGRAMVEKHRLIIGDILWVAQSHTIPDDHYVIDCLIERKTITDIISSIQSIRYHKQKIYQRKSGLKNCFYIVEGDIIKECKSELEYKSVLRAISEIEINDGFRIIWSMSLLNTFQLYTSITKALFKQLVKTKSQNSNSKKEANNCQETTPKFKIIQKRLQICKKRTVFDIWGQMLIRLTECSLELVNKIRSKFDTAKILYQEYQYHLENSKNNKNVPFLSSEANFL